MRSPLNKGSAPQVIRLFDRCFKMGVLDTGDLGDDYAAKDFLDKHKADGGYGLVFDDDNFDWRRWRFVLERWCREYKLGNLCDTYLNSPQIRQYNKTSIFAIIPMSMRFYLMGVEEYLDYPNPTNTAIFMQTPKIHWKPVPKHLKNMTTTDFLHQLQEFIYERQRLHLEKDLTDEQYDTFALGLWRLTRKYEIPFYKPPKKEI